MSSSNAPSLPELTGADAFLRAFDHQVRRLHGASHLSQLVLRLGAGFDPAALQKVLSEVLAAAPILRAPIRRRLWLGAPVYRTDLAPRAAQPRVRESDASGPRPAIPALAFERLNGVHDLHAGELLRADAVRYAGGSAGTDLVLTWAHMLLDGAGSEHFLRYLDECHRGVRRPSALPPDDAPGAPAHPGAAGLPPLRERGRRARAWQAELRRMSERPPRSLAGPLRRVPQALRYRLYTLDPAATQRAVARASERAGFLTPLPFYLACAVRAHSAVYRHRGLDPGSFVVPLAVDLRPRGADPALFRTRASLVWFQVLPEETRDLDGLVERLREQRRARIREGAIEAGAAALDFARFAPARLYARAARRAFRGELCSFFFAYTGEFAPGVDRFLGAEVENGFHAPSVPPSPGSALVVSLRRGRMNVTHVHQEGVLSPAELELFREHLLRDLCGGGGDGR